MAGDLQIPERETHPEHRSLWMATAKAPARARLQDEVRADVAVVGSGIVGMTAALLLQREGLEVVLLEADEIAGGATAHSTVKVTVGHGPIYSALQEEYGRDTAAAYLRANAMGMATIGELVRDGGIECDLTECRHVLFAEDEDALATVRREVEVERDLGLAAGLEEDSDLPFPVRGTLALEGQSLFHPRKYLLGLAEAFMAEGGRLYDRSRVRDLEGASSPEVRTDDGAVASDHVVVATGMPIVDHGFFFAKVFPRREYAIAAAIDPDHALADSYYSASSPTHSLRMARAGSETLLILVGESHKVGEEDDTESRYQALEGWLTERFRIRGVRYRWSTQDYDSMDRLPFVGYAGGGNVLTATGFGGWGMTNGTAAALAIRDTIIGRETGWAEVFDVHRHHPIAAAGSFLGENVKIAKHWIGDRLSTDHVAPGDLRSGEAAVTVVDKVAMACFRDDSGLLHTVSATCTHLGCLVAWNGAERSWDCPCHGSRFDIDGAVLQAPATEPLAPKPTAGS